MKKITLSFQKLFVIATLVLGVGGHAQGSLCTNPIVIGAVPYATTDNTANYGDNYDPPTSTSIACGSGTLGNWYLQGNDVIYSFTPTSSGTINIQIPSAPAWTGFFVFANCAQIGSPPLACSCSSAAGNRTVNNFGVTAGQTYYIVVSSWGSQLQSYAYTLNVTGNLDAEDFNIPVIDVFPNPVKDFLQVTNTDRNISDVVVYNLFGQEILRENWSGKDSSALNMTQLAAGTYLVSFEIGGKTITKKIVKY